MTATGATKKAETATPDETGRVAAIGAAVGEAAGTARSVASDAVARIPEVATAARTVIKDADREMQAGSDEMLVVSSALTFGLAGGLLLGGANRFLVAMAMMPAVMMVLTVMGRSTGKRGQAGRRLQGG